MVTGVVCRWQEEKITTNGHISSCRCCWFGSMMDIEEELFIGSINPEAQVNMSMSRLDKEGMTSNWCNVVDRQIAQWLEHLTLYPGFKY